MTPSLKVTASDISEMGEEEIENLLETIKEAKNEKKKAKQKEARSEIRRIASEAGLKVEISVAQTNGTETKETKTRPPAVAKYRSNDGKDTEWSGRGRSPRFITDYEKTGKSRDDLRILWSSPVLPNGAKG